MGPVVGTGAAAARGEEGRRELAFAVASVVAYLAAAVWAREMSLPGPVLIWFPPAGVAVAALTFRPRLAAPLVVVEAFSTLVVMDSGPDFGVLGLAVNSVGLVAAYSAGAWVLRRLGLDPSLRTPEDIIVLAFGAVVVAASLATVVGIGVQVWTDLVATDDIALQAGIFWVGDVVGMACVTPTLLIVGAAFLERRPLCLSDRPPPEGTTLLVVEILAPAALAVLLMGLTDEPLRFTYLAFVPVILLAVRHGVVAAALTATATTAVMTAGAHSLVPEAVDRSDFQLLLLVLGMTAVLTGAVVSARSDVQTTRQQLGEIIEATPDLVATADADGRLQYLNPVGRQLLGVRPEEVASCSALDFFPDDLSVDLMQEGMRAARRSGSWTGENRLRRSDGRVVPVSQVIIAHVAEDGTVTYSTVCRDMTSQRRLEDELRRAALYDEETHLPNRALLANHLDRLSQPTDVDQRTALLFLDLDAIPWVNERYGFATGEAAIVAVADRLRAQARGTDQVARFGGSRFVIVLPDVEDELDALRFALRLLDLCAEPLTVEGHELTLTASVGIALSRHGEDHHEPLRSAEIALHRAREAGGGRIALYDQDLEAQANRRMELEQALRKVLATGSWWLAYQPIVDARSGAVVSAEALLRWTDPERGPVAPFDLVRLAETSGAIVNLGREIFRRACVEAVRWHALGVDLDVGVNVSARQLREPTFLRDVRAVVEETGIDPERVTLELTETVLASDEHGEVATLHDVRELGCRIAIDDFGTGYSSLSGLQALPIDVVKIDRTFITGLPDDTRSSALVEAVVRMAEALDVTVVAEGVETPAQVEHLVELGCHRIQGFAVSRALSPEDLTRMLRAAPRAERSPSRGARR